MTSHVSMQQSHVIDAKEARDKASLLCPYLFDTREDTTVDTTESPYHKPHFGTTESGYRCKGGSR